MNTRLALALLPVAFVVAGCVHNDRAEPPAELTKIDQTLDVRKIWSNKVGLKVQLNVDNVLENGSLMPVAVNYDGSPYAFRIVDPRRFILSAAFDF